jgi:hypothetical protein
MKYVIASLLLFAVGIPFAQAADAPPTDASVKHLLTAMHASKMMDSVWTQMDGAMKSSIQQATAGQPLNDAQKAIVDNMSGQMVRIFRESMSWDKLEPIFIRVYQKSLTQHEVNGIAAFYATPDGQAMLDKMPVIMQNTMQEMQAPMREMMPKIQALARESTEKLKAAATPEPAAPAPAKSP